MTVDASTGALAAVAGAGYEWSYAMTIDPSGSYAFLVQGFSGGISAYAVDAASWTLTGVNGSRFPAPGSLVTVAVTR